MNTKRFRTLVLLLLLSLLAGVLMVALCLRFAEPQPVVTPLPTLVASASTPRPRPSRTPSVSVPPTWTPASPSPFPTATATRTPTPSQTPTASATPTPLNPGRPTLAPVTITVTPYSTAVLTIPTPVAPFYIPKEAVTVVLLGSDQRPDWDDWHTDAVQYVVIYPDVPAVSMLSIPRDLYLYIPNFWMSRINFADMYGELYNYEGGGFGLLNQTMLYNLGITADYYVKVNFDGLIGLVDAIGGIDMAVHCRLEDYWPYPDENGEYPWLVLEPGMHHMNGDLALWYSRSRKTTSVFSREQRQQLVLEAMWHTGKQANLLEAAPSLLSELGHLYETDMGVGNVLELAFTAMELDVTDVRMYNIGYSQVESYITPKGGYVFLPVWEEMAPVIADVLAKPASSRAFQAPILVEVWNGSGHADWDRLAADRLEHAGYTPVIGASDGIYPETRIIFFGGTTKGSGLAWVQSFFRVREENVAYLPDPNAAVKMRLIVGQDYVTCR
ncbi:MAG: LCP family protein [Anaerolineae bacterium]|nr:LCP family protein [Anaerolineae bacterium]